MQPEPDGFGLLETIRFEPDTGFHLLDGHFQRMARSARALGFHFDAGACRSALRKGVAGVSGPARVRLVLCRTGAARVDASPLAVSREPVRVRIAADPVDSRDPMLFHKTTRRAVYDTRLAAHRGSDDVLLVNERGEVTESTIANVVAEVDGGLWTPPLASGLLPGVLRAALLREGTVRERILRPADLGRADAVYLINSVRFWRKACLQS